MRSSTAFVIRQAIVAGATYHYIDEGTGPTLVLIHGSLCDCRYWNAQIRSLRMHFRVIAPSLRHYWPAQWDGLGEGFSIAAHMQGVVALLSHLGIPCAHWVGHSRGGRVALAAALSLPQALLSLTLADPGLVFAYVDSGGDARAVAVLDGGAKSSAIPKGMAYDAAYDPRGDFRETAAQHIAAGQTDAGLALFVDTVTGPQTWQRMVHWFKAMAHDNAMTLLGQIRETIPVISPQALQSLTLPCLLIGGALSPAPYPGILARLHTLLPNSNLQMIAGSSHGMNIGNARAFNRSIQHFLLDA